MMLSANEYIALPSIMGDASLKSMNFLSMAARGMIEIYGDENLLSWNNRVDSIELEYEESLSSYWIPSFSFARENVTGSIEYLAPFGHRAVAVTLKAENDSQKTHSLDVNMRFAVSRLFHTVNESKEIKPECRLSLSKWSLMPLYEFFTPLPFFSISLYSSCPEDWRISGSEVHFAHQVSLSPGEKFESTVFIGFGFEEVAAVTSARECERWGAAELRRQLVSYLDERIVHCADSRLDRVVNRNMFFCLFFSTGRTLDSEELVSVTSRSPEYYVSAAYWDRDSLLWAFPAICRADREKARELMLYVATRQRNNIGIHSRYIDGSILEPGFELDELVSPVLALDMYLRETGDYDLLSNGDVRCLIDLILSRLQRWYNVDCGLYETFLQPTDDMTGNCRMLTYDNVLVWKAFMILSDLDYGRKRNEFACKAENIRETIQKHCIISIDGCDEYVWAVDGKGGYEVYDEPPGSLLLLPVLGFCSRNDSVYMNTVARITDESYRYSFAGCPFSAIGCAHEPHPWTLSMANAVRASKDDDMVRKLCTAKMDDGIVCESIDEYTGECTSGKAFATAAGYVVYSLLCYLDEKKSGQDI